MDFPQNYYAVPVAIAGVGEPDQVPLGRECPTGIYWTGQQA